MERPADPSPLPDDAHLETVLDAFEDSWIAGERPEIAAFRDQVPAQARPKLVRELIKIDLECRWRRAEEDQPGPTVEDYLARFPESLQGIDSPLELIVEEYRVRSKWGDSPTLASYQSRFPHLGDSLRVALECVTAELSAQRSSETFSDGPTEYFSAKDAPQVAAADLNDGEDKYEVIEEIKRGGMGVVYRALDRNLKRVVALKVIRDELVDDPRACARFIEESRAASRLDHPHIVPIFEVGEYEDAPCYSMALIEGPSLSHRLTEGPFECREAAELAAKLAGAVQFAHENQIVHRDLKPSNVLFDGEQDRPRITDFGLAKQIDGELDLTVSGDVLGTPGYIPPEQIYRDAFTDKPTCDVYALGAILYEMLVGRPPFQASTQWETLAQSVRNDPAPPRQLNASIPLDLETICLKCLRKDPRGRYQTAKELGADLANHLEGRPIKARRMSAWERTWRWCRRHPARAGLIVVLPAILLLSMVLLVIGRDRSRIQQLYVLQRSNAIAQEYFSHVSEAGKQSLERALGWTWKNGDLIRQTAELPFPDRDLLNLRSIYTEAAGAPDLRTQRTINIGMAGSCIAFSPDGRFLAVGENQGGISCSVLIYDLSNERPAPYRKLSFSTLFRAFSKVFQGEQPKDGVRCLAYSPDGKQLAVGTRFGRLLVFDLAHPPGQETHADVAEFVERPQVRRLTFAHDNRTLFGLSKAGVFRCWRDGKEIEPPSVDGRVEDFTLHPTLPILAVAASGRSIQLVDLSTGTIRKFGAKGARNAAGDLAFSMDGRRLMTYGDPDNGQVLVYDVESGNVVGRWKMDHKSRGFQGDQPHFSPNGQFVWTLGDDASLNMWDTATGRLLASQFVTNPLQSWIAVSSNDRQVAILADRKVVVNEVRAAVQKRLGFSRGELSGACWSDNGRLLVTAVNETDARKQGGLQHIRLSAWDPQCGQLVSQLAILDRHGKGSDSQHRLAADCDASSTAMQGWGYGAMVWSGASLSRLGDTESALGASIQIEDKAFSLSSPQGNVDRVEASEARDGSAWSISPDTKSAAIQIDTDKINLPSASSERWLIYLSARSRWSGAMPAVITVTSTSTADKKAGGSIPLPGAAEGYHLVSLGYAPELDANTFELHLKFTADPSWKGCLIDYLLLVPESESKLPERLFSPRPNALSPEGKRYFEVHGSHQGLVRAFSRSGAEWGWSNTLFAYNAGVPQIYALAANEENLLVGVRDGNCFLLDAATGKQRIYWRSRAPAAETAVASVAIDPGNMFCVVGSDDGLVQVFDIDGKRLQTLTHHNQGVSSLDLDRAGSTLVSASRDQTIRVWRRDSNGLFEPWLDLPKADDVVKHVDITPSGDRLLVLIAGESVARVWDLAELGKEFVELTID